MSTQNRRLDYSALSKTIAHALRHKPWLYELELDDEGWVPVEELLEALRSHKLEWQSLSEADLREMIVLADKQRYELSEGRFRALYGHSVAGKLIRQEAEPPIVLYHGTYPAAVEAIRSTGLKPMRRQYVHLSTDLPTATEVARRRTGQPVILRIQAAQAHAQGVRFYRGNELVWLVDEVPAQFIDIP